MCWITDPRFTCRWFRKHSSSVTGLELCGLDDLEYTVGLRESFVLMLLCILSPSLQGLQLLGCDKVCPAGQRAVSQQGLHRAYVDSKVAYGVANALCTGLGCPGRGFCCTHTGVCNHPAASARFPSGTASPASADVRAGAHFKAHSLQLMRFNM